MVIHIILRDSSKSIVDMVEFALPKNKPLCKSYTKLLFALTEHAADINGSVEIVKI